MQDNQYAHNCRIKADSIDQLNAQQFDNDYQKLEIKCDSLWE